MLTSGNVYKIIGFAENTRAVIINGDAAFINWFLILETLRRLEEEAVYNILTPGGQTAVLWVRYHDESHYEPMLC